MEINKIIDLLMKEGYDLKIEGLLTTEYYFNMPYRVSDSQNRNFVLRVAGDKLLKGMDEAISHEYNFIGFSDSGKDLYRLRGMVEQSEFASFCKRNGVETPEVLACDERFMLRKFSEGEMYGDFLKKNSDENIILSYIKKLADMHSKEIVLGDRNGRNTIVEANKRLVFLDFDINLLKIKGEKNKQLRKDFEISQALYYSVRFLGNKEKILSISNTLAGIIDKEHEIGRIKHFLINYVEYKNMRINNNDYYGEKKREYGFTNKIVPVLVKYLWYYKPLNY